MGNWDFIDPVSASRSQETCLVVLAPAFGAKARGIYRPLLRPGYCLGAFVYEESEVVQGMNQRSKSMAILLGLGAILIIVSVLAVAIGSVHIPAAEVVAIILRRLHQLVTWQATNLELGNDVIVLNLRLPRAILAACVGACLALAGCMMQGLLRNPMADPYVIGVSAGASVGGAIAFLLTGALGWRFGIALTPLLAFLGAILAVVLVYLIARVDGRIPIMSLLLSGIALNTVLSAVDRKSVV